MKLKVGTKVLLKKSHAKWYLDHPDIYEFAGRIDPEYEHETLLHLMCCMDVPVKGIVIKRCTWYRPNTFLILFQVGNLEMSYWVLKSHITLI